MSEENSVRKLHDVFHVRRTGSVATSPSSDSCEELELRAADINGSKAYDVYSDILKLKWLVKEGPVVVTRDESGVYRFYFWMKLVRYHDSELSVQRLAISFLK